MIFIHICQDIKSIHLRQYHIQQNQRNTIDLLFQYFYAFFSALRLQDMVILGKNHIQKRPVDLLIIHYKDLRNHLFRLLLCVYLSLMINHVILGDGHVFLIFCLIHQFMCAKHCMLNRFVLRNHGTHTDRKLNIGIPRNHCILDLFLNLLQFFYQPIFLYLRQHKNKFISTIAHKRILSADTTPDHTSNRRKCHISGQMSVCIIAKLEIIHINHNNSGISRPHFYLFLKIQTIINSGQDILI